MRARQIAIALIIIALPVGFMHRTLIEGRPLARDDASTMVCPFFHALDEALSRGHLYLWDSQQWCGLPVMARGEVGALYPPHLLLALALPWQTALHLSYWLHLALGAGGAYLVARNLGATRGGSLIGGAAYAFSGYQAAHLIHYAHIIGVAYVPLMLAALQTALTCNTGRRWALFAIAAALGFLGSHPQVFLMAATVCLLWVIFGHDWRAEESLPHTRILPLLLAAAIAGLLVAPQLLPTIGLAAAQGKVAATDVGSAMQQIGAYPFHASDLARVLLPSFYGTVHAGSVTGPEWHETNPFTGAVPLLLGIAGAIAAFRRRGWGFCIAIFAVGAALMPAEGNPIHAALARLPFWASFRATGRWMVLPILSLSLLSALAITHLPEATRRARTGARRTVAILAVLIAALTVMLWLVFGVDDDGHLWLPGQGGSFPIAVPADAMLNCLTSWEPVLLVGAAIVAWIVAARLAAGKRAGALTLLLLLVAVGWPQWLLWQQTNLTAPCDYYTEVYDELPETARAVRAVPGRVTTLPPEVVTPGWQPPGATRDQRLMAERNLLRPALGTIWGDWFSEGYLQGLATPATRELWAAYYAYGAQAFTGEAELSPEAVRLFGTPVQRMKRMHRLAEVGAIVTTGTIDDPDLELKYAGVANVYAYRERHPRWWLAREAIVIEDPAAQLQAIKRLDFDPEEQVIVDRPVDLGTDARAETGIVYPVSGTTTNFKLSVVCPEPRVLVLADAWYPGWRVTVHGQPAELLRANYAFRGVVVPAGEHNVTFSFRPAAWSSALPMFGVGMLALIALLVWPKRKPLRRKGLTPP